MARIDSNAKITKIEILSDYFSDKAPLNGAYLKGEKIGVRLTITGASWTIGKGSITIDGDGVFQITEGIANSGDKNSRIVTFEIDLQEFVKQLDMDVKRNNPSATYNRDFKSQPIHSITFKMTGFDDGLFGTSEGVMKDYTGYFYNKGNLNEYNQIMYKSNGTAYSLERGVYVSNYIENPSISFSAGAATVDGKYFFENKIPYHNTNSQIKIKWDVSNNINIHGYLIKVEGKNNNSVLFSKLYYNNKDNSSLVIDTPSSIFSFDFLEVSIGQVTTSQVNAGDLTISGGTVTFKGYIVFSNKILNKMPQITWKDLVLSTSKQDSIDKINLALTNYQSGAMLQVKSGAEAKKTNETLISEIVEVILYSKKSGALGSIINAFTCTCEKVENTISTFLIKYSGQLKQNVISELLSGYSGMRYGNGYLKITVKDVFGYSVVLDATEIEELYALKGPLVFPGENLLTVKTNGLSYSPLRATSYGDSLLLLRDEGDFIRFEYPSIQHTGTTTPGSRIKYDFTLYEFNPTSPNRYRVILPSNNQNERYYEFTLGEVTKYYSQNLNTQDIFIQVSAVEVYGEGTEEEYTETMTTFPITATILKEAKQINYQGRQYNLRLGYIDSNEGAKFNGLVYLNSQTFTYEFSDNCGDQNNEYKQDYNNYANFSEYSSLKSNPEQALLKLYPTSLLRDGEEYLEIIFDLKKYVNDTETQDVKIKGTFSAKKDGVIDIGSVYLLRSYLLEGKRQKLYWKDGDWELMENNNWEVLDDQTLITTFLEKIRGWYNADETYQKNDIIIDNFSAYFVIPSNTNEVRNIQLVLNSDNMAWGHAYQNNPTLSYRKNGIIINGVPGQQLTEVFENGEVVGHHFLEINTLNEKDRIVIKYPDGISGEIYCDGEHICFSPSFAITNGSEKITFNDLVTFIRSLFPQ